MSVVLSDNKVKNGDFESGLYNWAIAAGAVPTIVVDAAAPTGSRVLKFNGVCQLQSEEYIPIDTTKNYFLECWVKVNAGSSPCYVGIIEFDSNLNFLTHQSGVVRFNYALMNGVASTSGYQHFTANITGSSATPTDNQFVSGTKYVCANLLLHWFGGSSGLPDVDVAYFRFSEVQSGADKTSLNTAAGIAGQGALATLNGVDFATSQVINKAAVYMAYASGATVESLKPSVPGADSTVTMTNMLVQNPGFEAGDIGWTHGDFGTFTFVNNPGNGFGGSNWYLQGSQRVVDVARNNGLCSVAPGSVIGAQGVIFNNVANGDAYIRLSFRGADGHTEVLLAESNHVSGGSGTWQIATVAKAVPSNAYFVTVECLYENVTTGWYAFDTISMFVINRSPVSTFLNNQGSLLPTQLILLSYTTTTTSITVSWSAQSMLFPDGSSVSIPTGSVSYSGLSASTTYYLYFYMDSSGNLQTTSGSPPPSTPNAVMAAQTGADGRTSIGVVPITTPSSGTGSGTGGGADTCPEASEMVDVRDKGPVAVSEVVAGDWVKGFSFQSQQPVYRKVIQAGSRHCSAWYKINGHLVSPCEPVYLNSWMPAYRVPGATHDSTNSYKVALTLEADQYEEQNYYLISGTPLLIHNIAQFGRFAVC